MIIDSKGKSNCWESADGSGYLADHSSGDGLHCWIRDTVSGSGDSAGDGSGWGSGSGWCYVTGNGWGDGLGNGSGDGSGTGKAY